MKCKRETVSFQATSYRNEFKPLELAARGAEKDCHDAFKVFAGMSLEEIRLTRSACWRLEEWCDSYLIGNGQGL